jgi:predicted enzyme related to lactoylglutathione lyase
MLSAGGAHHLGLIDCQETPMSRNAVNWFEIPAANLDRAQRFYEAVLGTPLKRQAMGSERMAIFPYEGDNAKTALPPGMGFFSHIEDTEGNVVGLHDLN